MDKEIKLSVEVNETTCALVYLSRIYKIDLAYLLFLYEKLGEDVLYLFYMLSGKNINFPKAAKLQRICDFASQSVIKLKNGEEILGSMERDRIGAKALMEYFDPESKKFEVTSNLENNLTKSLNDE